MPDKNCGHPNTVLKVQSYEVTTEQKEFTGLVAMMGKPSSKLIITSKCYICEELNVNTIPFGKNTRERLEELDKVVEAHGSLSSFKIKASL